MLVGPQKRAFTLVELLIVMAIIAMLAAMLLGVASAAMATARQARTQSLVTRLHTLLAQHYDSLRYQRVELNPTTQADVAASADRTALSKARLLATREQLKKQLPDRWSDILGEYLGSDADVPAEIGTAANPTYLAALPSITQQYLRRYNRLRTQTNTKTEVANTAADLRTHQGAECLYMIITMATGDGESRGLFKESDIGDVDGDGAPEFLDNWGNPIAFLRWAPGFVSDLQPNIADLTRYANDTSEAELLNYLAANPDPFDLFRMDRMTAYDSSVDSLRGFRLVPLIYSAGADKQYGIQDGLSFADSNATTMNESFTAVETTKKFEQVIDPYLSVGDAYLGEQTDRTQATDNITNHYFEGR